MYLQREDGSEGYCIKLNDVSPEIYYTQYVYDKKIQFDRQDVMYNVTAFFLYK